MILMKNEQISIEMQEILRGGRQRRQVPWKKMRTNGWMTTNDEHDDGYYYDDSESLDDFDYEAEND